VNGSRPGPRPSGHRASQISATAGNFVARFPFVFAVFVTAIAYVLDEVSRFSLPSRPVASVDDLSPQALEPPTESERVFDALRSSESTYWLLTILLAFALVALLGWWREAGFVGRPRWRALYLLWLPALAGALALSGGLEVLGPGFLIAAVLGAVLVAVGEEALFRGVVLRTLRPLGFRLAVSLAASSLAGCGTPDPPPTGRGRRPCFSRPSPSAEASSTVRSAFGSPPCGPSWPYTPPSAPSSQPAPPEAPPTSLPLSQHFRLRPLRPLPPARPRKDPPCGEPRLASDLPAPCGTRAPLLSSIRRGRDHRRHTDRGRLVRGARRERKR